jgi:hypothetical protein
VRTLIGIVPEVKNLHALFMTIRREIAYSPNETGAWSPRRREAYLKQYVDRLSGEPARLAFLWRGQACRNGEEAITAEALMNNVG